MDGNGATDQHSQPLAVIGMEKLFLFAQCVVQNFQPAKWFVAQYGTRQQHNSDIYSARYISTGESDEIR